MNFILKHYDTPLLTFSATMDTSNPEIKILWHNQEQEHLLPLDLQLTPESLSQWLRRRTIPKNRAFVHDLLAKCGLSLNRPMDIISVCKGLSLNDCYWVVEDGFNGDFSKNNLYENPFSNVLAALAFTGYGNNSNSRLSSSPEFTTNGTLPKCWRRINKGLGIEFMDAFNDMLVFDALICNTDRHFGNFGFLVDSKTNQIIAPAPLFDHGNALFNFAGASAWEREETLERYIQTLQPSVYDDFLGTAHTVLTPRHRQMLRGLLNFRFKRHSRYNLPAKRLKLMEKQIQKRAHLLLEP